ncbi:MAG: DUF1822 family protein [Coleofasciculus sp. S288]|nr:DUF1822 family protein [Coleofasciculus sp. S288]
MIYPIDSTELRLLQPEMSWLEPEYFDQAAEISDRVRGETQQWQTYLNVLGWLSFEQWFNERTDTAINQDHCSISQPKYANVVEAVCNLQVGEFKLCLIATESLIDETVSVPRSAIDLPEFAAHFYVLIEVQDEQEQVIIRGVLRYDELINYRESVNLQMEPDWSYQLPLSLFDAEPNHLLLYSRFLEASAIPLPVANPQSATLSRDEFEALLSGLQSPVQRLWESLSWEQGKIVLQSPELLDVLYQWQTQPERKDSLSIRLREVLTILTQKAVYTALWLRDELDELAKSLFWQPLPASTFATSSLRRLPDKFRAIATELKQKELVIPPQARGSYRELNVDGIALQLYAVTWLLPPQMPLAELPESSQEWALLLILEAQCDRKLPLGIKLRVSTLSDVVSEPVLKTDDSSLYTCVAGEWDEKFVVTIALSNGTSLTLPPIAFAPN